MTQQTQTNVSWRANAGRRTKGESKEGGQVDIDTAIP
jgi:hypothetical protein